MKSLILSIFIFVLFVWNVASAQVIVTDISNLKYSQQLGVIADVEGKILITEDLAKTMLKPQEAKKTGYELWPGWPLQYTGSANRGGIYCNMDSDPEMEILYCVSQKVYAFNVDGSVVDGWPVTTQLYPDGAPAFGDIDGDGEGEIVVSTRQAGTGNTGYLHAWEKNGSSVTGFPVTLSGGATKTAVLADLDGDNALEIIVEERSYPDGYVGVYKGNGLAFPGFPVALDYIPGSAVAVGDITGDNVPEIIAESYYSVYAYDASGNVLDGFPYAPGTDRVFSYSSPVLADMDGDGVREILVGDHSSTAGNGAVHIIKSNGSSMEGWPKFVSYWIYGPPAVGDIDGDGNLDVAIGDQVLSGSPADKVYAWDKNGTYLEGWPTVPMNAINNQIILADLDGDDQVELMWDDNTNAGVYIGYNHDGTPMNGWPLTVTGSSFFMNPFVTDIDGDGILDISGASGNLSTSDLYFYLWNTNLAMNPLKSPLTILQYNVRHDGVYVDASILSADFAGVPAIICEGDDVTFSDASIGDVISWEWEFEGGDPATSSEQSPVVNYPSSGTYDVTLTVSDGTNNSTITKEDYIKAAYTPEIPDQPMGPTDVVTSQTNFTIYETWCANATAYIWEVIPEDMAVIIPGDTITKVKIYWDQSNSYIVELRVKAENACGEGEFSEPLTIYVNWNTMVDNPEFEKPFSIYPNPASGSFTIDLKAFQNIESIQIIDIRGAEFKTPELKSSKLRIENLQAGIYFVKVNSKEGNFTEKIVVK
ncbi:MAG TPA: T9SS type A sorting domain-containing protein [Bacteroidales bacterium]|nr:T9SS type A sorting domain-containing protein [Bacteroidales bacterium]